MIVRLTGVLEDGSTPARNLPPTSRQELRLPRSSSGTIELAVVTRAGVPVPIEATDVITLHAKTRPDIAAADALLLTATRDLAAGVGRASFTVAAADTEELASRLLFDVWRTTAAGARDQLVALSPLVIVDAVGGP